MVRVTLYVFFISWHASKLAASSSSIERKANLAPGCPATTPPHPTCSVPAPSCSCRYSLRSLRTTRRLVSTLVTCATCEPPTPARVSQERIFTSMCGACPSTETSCAPPMRSMKASPDSRSAILKSGGPMSWLMKTEATTSV
eukprot:scaffold5173_cov125-Isochrysis_galbana.AAC.7